MSRPNAVEAKWRDLDVAIRLRGTNLGEACRGRLGLRHQVVRGGTLFRGGFARDSIPAVPAVVHIVARLGRRRRLGGNTGDTCGQGCGNGKDR
ncbi:MAG: hypothetical protein M3R02_24210 [Chloroflexota bacterium]|nr:hypothetical protein [Chloroflexota bacterium]